MDGDAFNIRCNRALVELQASTARSEAMLKELLELLKPPELQAPPLIARPPASPLPSPWEDFPT